MKKVLISILAVILIVLGYTSFRVPTETKPIKIGVVLPLSGDLAFIGEPARYGAEMALASFTNTKHKYELIFEDDQFDGKKSATAANKLISIDKVDTIISFGSSGGNVIKPLADTNKILHFAIASDQKIADGKYNFNHWTSPKEEVTASINELLRRNIKTISILTANQDGMVSIADELKRQAKNAGISIITDEKFNIGERDYRTLVAKLKKNLPEMIFMVNYSPELEILGRQIKEAGIKTPMTSFEGFDATTDTKLFSGYWYASPSNPSQEFTAKFKGKYQVAPAVGTGNVFDVVSLIITATEKVKGTPTAERISIELLKINKLNGSMGDISVGSTGSVVSQAIIKIIK
jgi:branched-chain amino acid transport system substrate-binding protein